MTPAPRRIVVVGGGAGGVLVAIALLRAVPGPTEVVVVERTGQLGEGVAYSTRDPLHRLNVPAAKLAATLDEPDDFLAWARAREASVTGGDFLPRADYGAYLRDALRRATEVAGVRGVTLQHRAGAVVAVLPGADGRERVALEDGAEVEADDVVLALGIGPPTRPSVLDGAPHTFASPWSPGALEPLPPGSTCLLVGSGLTAIDAALSVTAASPDARVVAVSRTGLVPFAHLPPRPGHAPAEPPTWPDGPLDLDVLAAALRAHVAAVRAAGGDWRDAVDSLRPQLTGLWQRLPLDEQRRFLRDGVRWWDVRRHRMAPDVGARVEALRADGRLTVLAGRIADVRAAGDGVDVIVGVADDDPQVVHAARVIACTGFGSDVAASADPLLRSLLAARRATPDALGIGLRTSDDGALVDAEGVPAAGVHVLGALRRGELWESTAVPELRAQAAAIATRLAARPD
ncbi:MAG: FAD-dependent pyridine nucleotide-disulfide oxidoreductase [Thermoleophilia bacterium]|nr:FAD-dependent pyridine nucleotide-disulfide oxidoreductase [Thermoleophilia bacterium]